MSSPSMETRNRNVAVEVKENINSADVPSGFILKLYEMVNGAPDDVISWTPTGDAFIIGSNLKRLESETLPQYFRHNRFQSLVRQLNFYSFRKINRERNVWIYKHELFHRDRPGDLHMVRRRTCPGMDGRKQRFSRYSAPKLTDNSGSDDDSSVDAPDPSPGEEMLFPNTGNNKRDSNFEGDEGQQSKRPRATWNTESTSSLPKEDKNAIDTSLIVQDRLVKPEKDEEENRSWQLPVNERTEIAERSLVVSEVAKKLAQYARKAFGQNSGKGKCHSSGVVTPPFGTSTALPTTSLLTYDDEYSDGKETHCQVGIVTDGDESTSSGDDDCQPREAAVVSPKKRAHNFTAPAGDFITARGITERLKNSAVVNQEAKAALASFCIITSPHGDKDIGSKILQLIASCESLAMWFNSYRRALHPFSPTEKEHMVGSYDYLALLVDDAESFMLEPWAREASRLKATNDFAVFAVNCLHHILGKVSKGGVVLTEDDKSVLERTILVWSKHV